jgi:phosphatidylglycerol lysyltransferase
VAAVHLPAGRISAFTNIAPEYRRNEISVDLMRRRSDTENGTMDFLGKNLRKVSQVLLRA